MPINTDTVWTDEMMRRFRALHASGLNSFETIASILRVEFKVSLTKNACIGKGRRMGLKQRRQSYWPAKPTISKTRAAPKPKPRKKYPNHPIVAKPEKPQESIPAVLPGWHVAPPPKAKDRITIYQLTSGRCHYPFGDNGPPYTYCGEKTARGVWCGEHAKKVFNR